jgi:hypothetical protein
MFSHVPEVPPRSRTLYLTFNAARNFLVNGELHQWFIQALRSTLDRGWDVCQLIRLDHSLHRSVRLVNAIQAYVGAKGGTYLPYYHTRYGVLEVPDGLCIVPDIGALALRSGPEVLVSCGKRC